MENLILISKMQNVTKNYIKIIEKYFYLFLTGSENNRKNVTKIKTIIA